MKPLKKSTRAKPAIRYVGVRFPGGETIYTYFWDRPGKISPGDLAVVVPPSGGFTLVTVAKVSLEPEPRANKFLVGVVPLALYRSRGLPMPGELAVPAGKTRPPSTSSPRDETIRRKALIDLDRVRLDLDASGVPRKIQVPPVERPRTRAQALATEFDEDDKR